LRHGMRGRELWKTDWTVVEVLLKDTTPGQTTPRPNSPGGAAFDSAVRLRFSEFWQEAAL